MIIKTKGYERVLDFGTQSLLFSLYSTIVIRIANKDDIGKAISFLQNEVCDYEDALECARQFNLIRDSLSQVKPEYAVYNMKDLSEKAPWSDNLSPIVTSCGNLFLTSDGKDLLFEIVSILTFAYYKKLSVNIE